MRCHEITRETRETQIRLCVDLDNPEKRRIKSPVPFLNHMLETLACHGEIGLDLFAQGDVQVDPHHLIEDCGICLGKAIKGALKNSGPIRRAGFFIFPMDRSLAQAALDICGRPNLKWSAMFSDPMPKLFQEFFKGLADHMGATLHISVPYLDNDHHGVEAIFKAFGRALRRAIVLKDTGTLLSVKGIIDD